jgi:hypothetical protein
MTSVLDLPEEKQKELARREGKSLAQWREDTKAFFRACAAFEAKLAADTTRLEDLTPEQRAQAERFQARVDSESSVPIRSIRPAP